MTTASISLPNILQLSKITWRFLGFFGAFLFALLLDFYIFQVNEVTRVNFLIANSQKQISSFEQENKELKRTLSQMSSPASLEATFRDLSYEKTQKIHYIRLLGDTVAVRPK